MHAYLCLEKIFYTMICHLQKFNQKKYYLLLVKRTVFPQPFFGEQQEGRRESQQERKQEGKKPQGGSVTQTHTYEEEKEVECS